MTDIEKKKEELVQLNFKIKDVQEKINAIPITNFILNKEIAILSQELQGLVEKKYSLENSIKDMEENSTNG